MSDETIEQMKRERPSEWEALKKHIEEAKNDPDYDIVASYPYYEPKKIVVAPNIPASSVMHLRAHVDECVTDPDYSVVLSYEVRWDESPVTPDEEYRRRLRAINLRKS